MGPRPPDGPRVGCRAPPGEQADGRRWPPHHGDRPPRPGPAGRLRRLRRLGPRRGRRQADLLRPLRPAAPRTGVRGHRGQQRAPDPGLQGHGAGLAGLRRVHAGVAEGTPRDRPLALLHDRRQHVAERPADLPAHRRRLHRARPQRQPDQHPRARPDGHRPPRPRRRAAAAHPRHRDLDQRHRARHRAARAPPRHVAGAARAGGPPAAARRLLLRLDERGHALRRARPAGHPPAGARPPRPRLGGRQRGRRPRDDRRQRGPRGRARRDDRHRRERPALPHVRRARPQGLRVRVRLPRPPRRHHQRPQRPRGPGRDGPPARPGVPGRRRPGHPGPRVGHARRVRLRRRVRHPLRPGLRQERLRRTHLHPAQPDAAPARHPAQAQRARAHDPRQADRRGRRLDRARQHPACPGADAARGRRPRGARPHLEPPGEVAVLLRHRLRHPRRADRQRPHARGDRRQRRGRHARLHLARGHDRGHGPAAERLCTACFTGEYPIELPDESLLGKHLLEATLQSPTMGRALPVLNNP